MNKRRHFYDLGFTLLTTVAIIATGTLVVFASYIAYQYFTDKTSNLNTVLENVNGILRTVNNPVTALRDRSIAGFFQHLAEEWRPVNKASANELQRLEQFGYGFETGKELEIDVGESDEVIPDTNAVANDNVNTPQVNGNVGENANEAPVNQNSNTNESQNANEPSNQNESGNANQNTNQVESNTSPNTNSEQNINIASGNENTNAVANANENIPPGTNENVNVFENTNTNQPANANENLNLPENANLSQNLNQTENVNIPSNVNETSNTNEAMNINEAPPANTSVNENVNSAPPEPIHPTVISRDEWYRSAPRGELYVQANWCCSSAATILSFQKPDGTTITLGLFHGDCTNPNAVVTGTFIPQHLGTFRPNDTLLFEFSSVLVEGNAPTINTSDVPEFCSIDYFRAAGHPEVYAIQYTCDEGFHIGIRDDIQFTVYAFPPSWGQPGSVDDLLSTADRESDDDGDGLVFREERELGTNPNHWDSDGDILGDFEELKRYTTDPLVRDSDGDGFSDLTEINGGYNPLGPGKATADQLAAWESGLRQPGKPTYTHLAVTVSGGRATVSWDLDVPADGIVNYGPTDAYGEHVSDFSFVNRHTIGFSVESGKEYHYAIRSCAPAPTPACVASSDLVLTAKE